jgi:anti-repressor protein
MHELIHINDEAGKQTVNARELHAFLEVGKDFSTWIKGRIEQYDFVENEDYVVTKSIPQNGGSVIDYHISLDMAKELAMVQRNDKGKQARRYFIECEKAFHQVTQYEIPQTLSEALILAGEKQRVIEQLQPKADFADAMMATPSLCNTTLVAKKLGTSAITLNRFLYARRIIYKASNGICWVPYSKWQDAGLCDIRTWVDDEKDRTRYNLKWTQKGVAFICQLWWKYNTKPESMRQPELIDFGVLDG